jgi:hypothetical protein
MSALDQIKYGIKAQRKEGSFTRIGPTTPFGIRGTHHKPTILPPKPKSSQQLLDVSEERAKSSQREENSKNRKNKGKGREDLFGEKEEEDIKTSSSKRKHRKKKEVAWGPSTILEHLNEPEVVLDIDGKLLPSLMVSLDEKGKEVEDEIPQWDHGESTKGKQSDNNFFLWLEAYSHLRCEEKKEEENKTFF